MKFSIRDLKEFKFNSDGLICTTTFVKPVHIVMMSAVHNYTNLSINFSNNSANEYAKSMNFQTPLEINTVDGQHHSKAIKLENQFDNDSQVDKVMKIFRNNNYLDSETNEVLELILAEIFQNFYAHAEFDEPPICCVQDWSTSQYVEIAIADTGIGIDNSLEEVLKEYPNDTNPCRIACDSGISCSLNKESRIGTTHGGFGLFFTKRFIEENGGHLYLLSGEDCYINRPDGEYDETVPYRWNGTIVRLIINKNKCLPSEAFWKSISREQEGEDYDEFF